MASELVFSHGRPSGNEQMIAQVIHEMDVQSPAIENKMAEINRLQSPMDICDENVVIAKSKLDKHRRNLEEKQRIRSPFLIGSIDEVNSKISKLNSKLQEYTKLAMEDYHDDDHDEQTFCARRKEAAERRDRENKEMNQFAGLYAIKSTLMPGKSDRVKNISKISMKSSGTNVTQKEGGMKPRFAEMYQYPGYVAAEVTPLPRDASAVDILHKVTNATINIDRKSMFKEEFERLFYSTLSQAILQDVFWYVFVVKYQHKAAVEKNLFSRIAHNYVKLLMLAKGNQMSYVTFFKDYPTLVAQAVYAVFCECFPDSFRQYDHAFKDYICNLMQIWMTGTKAPTGSWLDWNFKQLEPPNIRQTEELTQATTSKSSMTVLEVIRNLGTSVASPAPAPNSRHSSTSNISTGKAKNPSISTNDSAIKPSGKFESSLKPIKEQGFTKKSRVLSLKSPKNQRKVQESHPLPGSGPDFIDCMFDIYGHSPLMNHVLRKQHSDSRNKCVLRIHRTEIVHQPAPDAKTYRDAIRESLKSCKTRAKRHAQMLEQTNKDRVAIRATQREYVRAHRIEEAAILSKPSRVKKACDMLILEKMNPKKDADASAFLASLDISESAL